jgi:hypothetical protein
VGSGVFVCDNLAFSGEVTIARWHTTFIERDLPQLVDRAIGRLEDLRADQDRRIDAYKHKELPDIQAHDVLVQAVDARVLPVSKADRLEPEQSGFDGHQGSGGFSLYPTVAGTQVPQVFCLAIRE